MVWATYTVLSWALDHVNEGLELGHELFWVVGGVKNHCHSGSRVENGKPRSFHATCNKN